MATKSRIQSQNFLTSIVTLIFMAFGVQGIQINLTGEQVVTEVMAQNWDFIVNALIPTLSLMVFKLSEKIKDKTFQWSLFVKDTNFMTFGLTVIIGLLNGIGFVIAETASAEIAAAIASGSVISILIAIFLNVANPLWHFIRDLLNKNKVTTNTPA